MSFKFHPAHKERGREREEEGASDGKPLSMIIESVFFEFPFDKTMPLTFTFYLDSENSKAFYLIIHTFMCGIDNS